MKLNISAILLLLCVILFLTLTNCTKRIAPEESNEKIAEFAIVIHGGAGAMKKGMYSEEKENEYKTKLTEALIVGYKILNDGGSSLDAVEKVIRVLEDSPLFNAGKGAVFTNNGVNELDASIMDGKTLNCGAVAGVKTVKNPISLARGVMEKSKHVLMACEGAEKFAEELGLKIVDKEYFQTEARWNSLQKALEKEKTQSSVTELEKEFKYGTVGCVALDKAGNLAAGTSTGGMTNKKWGRVGDSPIIGAGTYADNKTCAISATGHGEFFIRNVVAHDISARMKYKKESLKEAADKVVMNVLTEQGADGGVIAIDKNGRIAMPFNTRGMFRGYITDKNEPFVAIYEHKKTSISIEAE